MPAASMSRAERTLATRRRMVEGAYRRFCRDGYGGTTMNAIAEEAGVAVQTLYYTFHTKAALLGEAIGAAILGFDEWRGVPQGEIGARELKVNNPAWPGLEGAATAGAALEAFVAISVPVLDRIAPLLSAMHGGTGDAEAESVVALAEERRIIFYREVARLLSRKPGGLREGVSVATATDLLLVFLSAEVHQGLVGRGWSPARCESFYRDVLRSQLLGAK